MDGFGGVWRHIPDCRVDLRRRERACGWRASTRVQSRFPGNIVANGIVFGLYLAFTAAQVWGDIDRANAAVNREASALSAIVILAASFPGEPEQQTRALVRRYIENTAFQEWPTMARRHRRDLGRSRAIAAGSARGKDELKPPYHGIALRGSRGAIARSYVARLGLRRSLRLSEKQSRCCRRCRRRIALLHRNRGPERRR